MNAIAETDRLLAEHGAILVREGKHRVYQLPGGRVFTRPKTPSDHRSTLNSLANLRRVLGIRRAPPPTKGDEIEMSTQKPTLPDKPSSAPAPTCAQAAPVSPAPPELPPVATATGCSLRERIQAAIAAEEQNQERVLAEAQAVERRVNMLKALLPFAEDPSIEESLRGVLPVPQPPVPPMPGAPPPPEAITERVQVTRQLVLAATQTFAETFTVNDVMELMANGHHIDPGERGRVRASIAQAMVTLHERGELAKEQEHFGRRQTIWRKAQLNGGGHRNGVGTRA